MIRMRYGHERICELAHLQIAHYLRTQQGPGRPAWYETQRKTTHVVFWS